MNQQRRIKRPKLERTEPIRNWTTLLGGGTAARTEANTASGDAPANAAGSAERGSPFGDVIARSVDLGYRVVDEYVRQGQKAAERLSGRGAAPETIATDMQDAALRMTQYASDFVGLWFEVLGLTTPGAEGRAWSAPSAAGSAAPEPSRPASTAPAGDATRVHIDVASVHPVEVALDLRPAAAHCPLAAQPLRAVGPELPPLTEVSFTRVSADEPVRLRLRVPAEQPPGVYNGLVTDERTNRPVGTVSVRVGRG